MNYEIITHTLDFIINERYFCTTFLMDNDNYCLRIYDLSHDKEELYSAWFDSDLGMFAGNDKVITLDNIDDVIDDAFKVVKEMLKCRKLVTL